MSASTIDFAHLLRPHTRSDFLERYWETKPLHIQRGDTHYYDSLVTLADLEAYVASPQARYPAVQLSRGGAYFPAAVYTDDVRVGTENFTGVIDLSKVAAEYRAGATVVLPAIQTAFVPLRECCVHLESELTHRVHANAYLTPGHAAGFSPHYDTHEVFVLQIAGRKLWRIFEPALPLPHRKQPFSPQGYQPPAAAAMEAELQAGDLLYLPRGFVHTTQTSAAHSAHVTVGVDVYTWLDLAGEVLAHAMTNPRFRKALPPGFAAPQARAAVNAELTRLLDELRDSARSAPLLEMFLSRLRPIDSAGPAPFRAAVSVIDENTWLKACAPEQLRVLQSGGKIALEHQARRYILQTAAWPALQAMLRLDRFRAIDLPGALDLEATLTLLRLLQDRGVLSYA